MVVKAWEEGKSVFGGGGECTVLRIGTSIGTSDPNAWLIDLYPRAQRGLKGASVTGDPTSELGATTRPHS